MPEQPEPAADGRRLLGHHIVDLVARGLLEEPLEIALPQPREHAVGVALAFGEVGVGVRVELRQDDDLAGGRGHGEEAELRLHEEDVVARRVAEARARASSGSQIVAVKRQGRYRAMEGTSPALWQASLSESDRDVRPK